MTPEEAEFYPTPAWCTHRILEALDLPGGHWFDPCVGEGAIPDAVYLPGVRWTTVDIRDTGYADHVEDYLRARWPRADVCIMNPPFSKALQFAAKAMEHCNVVVMLQRLNWLASAERADWLRENPPGVYVLPNRPSFYNASRKPKPGSGRTQTSSEDYAWYVWPPCHATVQILASTSIEERRRCALEHPNYPSPRQQSLELPTEA